MFLPSANLESPGISCSYVVNLLNQSRSVVLPPLIRVKPIILNDTLAPLSGVKLGPLFICHGVLSVASPHRLVKYFFTTAEKLPFL